jgi:hypothetical protein
VSWRASAYIKELQQCPNGESISRGEKLVGLILADSHQDKVGAYTYPSVQTMAADARMDERTCRRTLSSLERKGVIVRLRAEHQGRGQVTFYRFPELDETAAKTNEKTKGKGGHSDPLSDAAARKKGGQDVRLFSAQRRAKGGQKEDKTAPHTIGRTGTGTQKQKQSPHIPPAGGTSGLEPAIDHGLEPAIEQVMSDCAWTKRRLREKLRAVLLLESSKGTPPATAALAIAAAWKHQSANSHLVRGKFGPANFLELGIWKDSNLLMWDHERMDREARRL